MLTIIIDTLNKNRILNPLLLKKITSGPYIISSYFIILPESIDRNANPLKSRDINNRLKRSLNKAPDGTPLTTS
jgi:hypothetical protein